MRDSEARFKEKGANLLAIGLGGAAYARLFREETNIEFPLLVDDGQTHKVAGLRKASLLHLFRFDNALAWRRWKLPWMFFAKVILTAMKTIRPSARKGSELAGHSLKELAINPFHLGGSFVFGPGNLDHFVHISRTFGDNAPMDALLAAVPPR